MSKPNQTPRPDPMRHAGEIAQYVEQDRVAMPPAGGIVFTGSSSVRLWDVKAGFPSLPVLNRGFGGSVYADVIHFFDRVITPYKPSTVVLYSGDNDAACGLRSEEIFHDFKQVVEMIFAAFPKARVLCMSTKISPCRWELDEVIRGFNAMMESFTRTDGRLRFVDIYHPMLGADNRPRMELFGPDGLHMTPAGYDVWNATLRPYLTA